jgi:GrpB-like predicted nucleotidyltransferase (UPF0157 family)
LVRLDPIRVVPYDPVWPAMFDQQRMCLEAALAPALTAPVEHIGSTAVPGLESKPIIDMLAVVRSIDDVDAEAVRGCGWVLAPEPGDEEESRLSFCRPSVEHRTHHLHVVEESFCPWMEWIAFRDYLRVHQGVAHRYGELKRSLASEHGSDPNDRDAYRSGKSAFVRAVLEQLRNHQSF